jgi:P22_AR N-terminal domain
LNDEYENEDEREQEQEQPTRALIPIEQETVLFRGKPLVVVRLPDGRLGVVLRWICENLQLLTRGQIARIRRTEVIADDLVYVQVQTDGGPQTMATLVLQAAPYWLATIDTRRMDKDSPQRLEVLQYQREVVAALYEWASTRRPQKLVPSEPITRPEVPVPGATAEMWLEYHQQMIRFLEWQRDMQAWQGSVESRLEGLEAMTSLIPEILDRLPPETITPAHQRQVQVYVKQLADLTGKHPATIYTDLYTAFSVPRYQDLLESEWQNVENWFRIQIDRAKARKNRKP